MQYYWNLAQFARNLSLKILKKIQQNNSYLTYQQCMMCYKNVKIGNTKNFIDSVYLSMPEQIITQMLVTKGTTISHTEIVEDYLKNKQFYHDTILKSMDIQKKYIPDSLPNKDKPDKQLNKSDTVNKINNNK